MIADKAIEAAIDAIGEGKTEDYVISPTSHAEEFREKAPALAAILCSSRVKATSQRYENEDREALFAQNKFRLVFKRANATVLATGAFIALVLATAAAAPELPKWLVTTFLVVLSLGSVITGALASKDLLTIRQGRLLEAWMSKRASAETARLDYFDLVTKSSTQSTTKKGPPLALLQFEYFRRFQLDVQLAYYRKREKDHREEAEKTLSYSGWAVAGAAIATGSAGVLGASLHASFAAIAAFGTIFTGLSSFASMREAVNQDRRNAERYGRTYRVLEDLSKRLDAVRKAVYTSGMKPLSDFVAAVHEQLSLEHRQWLGELGEKRGAFAELERTLKELSKKVAPQPQSTSGS